MDGAAGSAAASPPPAAAAGAAAPAPPRSELAAAHPAAGAAPAGRKRGRRAAREPRPLPVPGELPDPGEPFAVPQRLAARVLYANPVCMLSAEAAAADGAPPRQGLMTISWLTCIDNSGTVFLSLNEGRATAAVLLGPPAADGPPPAAPAPERAFCLSVPVAGSEELLRQIGGCSARDCPPDGGKPGALGVALCAPGWQPLPPSDRAPRLCAVDHPLVVAHVALTLLSWERRFGHYLLYARISQAWVRRAYWAGDTFQPTRPDLPPYLGFFGGGRFALSVPAAAGPPSKAPRTAAEPAPQSAPA
eukprot:TRINITY_DN30819_c0_g1_i1.p2 TRINITY_DN30819_c0_g1~~TRINITY_DN30819_c0_g1_i1.p2  ORF type:complete len:304 (+),score=71.27 TRINITY_DN30819_c0_g1_i1:93-1004(+)